MMMLLSIFDARAACAAAVAGVVYLRVQAALLIACMSPNMTATDSRLRERSSWLKGPMSQGKAAGGLRGRRCRSSKAMLSEQTHHGHKLY